MFLITPASLFELRQNTHRYTQTHKAWLKLDSFIDIALAGNEP